MIQTCLRLEKDAYLSSIPCDSLPAQPVEGEGDFWLEIEAVTPEELVSRIKPFALHPLMVEDILNLEHNTLLDRYTEAVYIEFPTNLDDSGDASQRLRKLGVSI
jgi:Mg2+ and Co2+ transporter CorA